MSKIYPRFIIGLLLVAVAYSPAAQSQQKVVVIPLDSERPAIEIVDGNGATVGAATAGNFVVMRGNLITSRRTPVFLVPILQNGFFSTETSTGVIYSSNNCTGTPKILTGPNTEFPALEVATVGFDPEAGPHALDVGLSEIRAFIRISPTTTTSAVFNSVARFDDGEWQCSTLNGFGLSAVELEMATNLSSFNTPFSARMR